MENKTATPPPIICFTSGKGGCGKTTLAINFANIISRSGQRVVIVDCDVSNRGSTGTFHECISDSQKCLSFADLLGKRDPSPGRGPIRLKDRLFFVPSFDPHDPEFNLPISNSAAELGQRLREAIHAMAKEHDIACVVLDSFCGIDATTTASAIAADKVIIVNEPDIITFTGSINLLNHLNESFASLDRKPDIHFVINRVRFTNTVRRLSVLYKNTLEKAVHCAILCYFPYNKRIFENFGKYPYISDVLPKSLFVKKLQLLAYALFKGNHDHLLERKVTLWSGRTLKSVYVKLFDRTSMDEEQVIVRISQIPVFAALWFLGSCLVLRSVSLSPGWAMEALGLSLSGLFCLYLYWLWSFWNFMTVNINVAIFRYRLNRLRSSADSLVSLAVGARTGALPALAASVFFLFFLVMLILVVTFAMGFKELVAKGFSSKDCIEMLTTMETPIVKSLSLRNQTVRSVDFTGKAALKFNKKKSHFLNVFESSILVDNANFVSCSFAPTYSWEDNPFEDIVLTGAVFDSCVFEAEDSLLFKGSHFNGVTFKRFFYPKSVVFRRCHFNTCSLEVDRITFIRLDFSTFDNTVFYGSRRGDPLFLCTQGYTLPKGLTIDSERGRCIPLSDNAFQTAQDIASKIWSRDGNYLTSDSMRTIEDTLSYFANRSELLALFGVFSKGFGPADASADSVRMLIGNRKNIVYEEIYRGSYFLLKALIALMRDSVRSPAVDLSLKNLVAWHDANLRTSDFWNWYLWDTYQDQIGSAKKDLAFSTRKYMQKAINTPEYQRQIREIYARKFKEDSGPQIAKNPRLFYKG